MEQRRLCILLVVSLLGNAFCLPLELRMKRVDGNNELDSNVQEKDLVGASSEIRPRRQEDSANSLDSPKEDADAEADSPSKVSIDTTTSKVEFATPVESDDDDDEDFDEPQSPVATTGGGSNIFSLLRLANALFPSSSSGGNILIQNLIREYLMRNQFQFQINRRLDVLDNEIDIDYTDLKPPSFQRQETKENNSDSENIDGSESRSDSRSESLEDDDDKNDDDQSDDNNAAEVSVEDDKPTKDNGNSNGNGNENASNGDSKSKQDSNGDNGNGNDSDYDSDEPPEGDGQGGGILGLLAGLSGGEDGQSDLGSLLATVSGIVANLSGDGIDLNALIASGLGLFVGLLSEGEENPGAIIASYLLTSLESFTGGGSQNNGAFFGTFLSKLISGTSAGGDPDASSEENGGERPKDSSGFFASFLMALFGEMSKMSSKGSSSSSCSSCHES